MEKPLSNVARQFDLFDHEAGFQATPAAASRSRRRAVSAAATAPGASAAAPGVLSPEAMAQALAQTGDYRILRRLQPRPVIDRALSPLPRLAVIVDTETTGLRHDADEVIEIGAVAFTYGDDGAIGDVVGVYGAVQEPSRPVPPEITRLTGITDAMVAGQRIDEAALAALLEPADLVIAHNAGFDRPFCEALSPVFATKAWACSVKEVSWRDYGFEGAKLGYLVGQAGLFHDGHRAVDDCHALLEVLARPVCARDDAVQAHPGEAPGGDATAAGAPTPFAALLAASRRISVRIWAERSPFDMKDQLKARGYRWSDGSDGRPRAWWIETPEDAAEEELRFLRDEIYQWPDASPYRQVLSAQDRFRAG